MSEDDLSKEITNAWAEFIKNSDEAKAEILSAFNEDMEGDDGGMTKMIACGVVGTLTCILVALAIYSSIKTIKKKKENWTESWLWVLRLNQVIIISSFNKINKFRPTPITNELEESEPWLAIALILSLVAMSSSRRPSVRPFVCPSQMSFSLD